MMLERHTHIWNNNGSERTVSTAIEVYNRNNPHHLWASRVTRAYTTNLVTYTAKHPMISTGDNVNPRPIDNHMHFTY